MRERLMPDLSRMRRDASLVSAQNAAAIARVFPHLRPDECPFPSGRFFCEVPIMTVKVDADLSEEDGAELQRLLQLVFKSDETAATKWLNEPSGVFRCRPFELLKRDELGVVRVISYLKDAVQ